MLHKKIFNSKIKKITYIDIIKVFLRSNFLQGSWNFERMQALGFCFLMMPVIHCLYNDNKHKKEAVIRHLEFFNTNPYISSIIIGVTIAMEEKYANNKIESSVINHLKVSLMGPLASVGDTIFWGSMRPILAAFSASIALSGNLLGPLLFFLIFNILRLAIRYYGIIYGYNYGVNIIDNIDYKLLKKIIEGSSILGLFVIGSLISKCTHMNISYEISNMFNCLTNDIKIITIQSILDQIMPNLVPLLLTLICLFLIKNKINTLLIILGIYTFSILGYLLGILT